MKKHISFFIGLLAILIYSRCGVCFDIDDMITEGIEPRPVSENKLFHIVNHTKKTYKNNGFYILGFMPEKASRQWHLFYRSETKEFPGSLKGDIDEYSKTLKKIPLIKANETTIITKKDFAALGMPQGCRLYEDYFYFNFETRAPGFEKGKSRRVFLLSLDSGKRKVFFGIHDYGIFMVTEEIDACRSKFIKWKIAPIFKKEKTEIHIYENKIEAEGKVSEIEAKGKMLDIYKVPIVDVKNCDWK